MQYDFPKKGQGMSPMLLAFWIYEWDFYVTTKILPKSEQAGKDIILSYSVGDEFDTKWKINAAWLLLAPAGLSRNRGDGLHRHRVAKCHRYICVKILEGWGKKFMRPHSFVKWSSFKGNSTNLFEVLS